MSFYEIRGKKRKTSLFDSVISKVFNALDLDTEKLGLKMRYVDVLRGEELVNDIKDTFIEYYPQVASLNLGDIITVLYSDFLRQIKNGNQNHKLAAEFLLSGKSRYLAQLDKPKVQKKEFHQVNQNTFIFEDVDDDEDLEELSDKFGSGELVFVDILFKKRDINRGKVFLYDITTYLNDEVFSLEDMIVIRYLNFIEQVRLEGNSHKVMKAILKNLGYKKTLE